MDRHVRITTLITWVAWTLGTALVLADTLDLLPRVAPVGILVSLYGAVWWTRDRFGNLSSRELVAFDHGRKFERSAGQDVVRIPSQR